MDFSETVGFAVFLAGVGLGVVSQVPVLALGWYIGLRMGQAGTAPLPETAEQRRARLQAEYREAAGRG